MSDLALIAIGCGIAAAAAWGVADFFAAKTARFAGPGTGAVLVNIIGLLSFGIFYLLAGPSTDHFGSTTGVLYALSGAIVLGIAQLTFFRALEVGPVSLVSPLAGAYPLVTTIGVVVAFHARLAPLQLVGIAAVMLGILAASDACSLKKTDRRLGKGPLMALLTALCWGIGYTFLSRSFEVMDWQSVTLIQVATIAAVCFAIAPFMQHGEKLLTLHKLRLLRNPYLLLAGIVQMAGMVAINIGLNQDLSLAPVVTAVSACYPVITIVLALKHFKEEFKIVPLAGAAVCVIGIVVLSLGS